MSYVAVAQPDRATRLALASTRWHAILSRQPELAEAIALQRQLVDILVELSDRVEQHGLPRLSLPARYGAAKLKAGVPLLAGEPIPLPLQVLTPALGRLCETLGQGGAGEAADHIRTALEEMRLDPGSLLTASLGRDQIAIRQGATHRGLAPDLLWLVSELAVSPFAHALQRSVLASLSHAPLETDLQAWPHGYCPLCGSWPALTEVASANAVLRCSFCSLAWERQSKRCTYCGEAGDRFKIVANDVLPDRRVECCDACSGYLKVLDVNELSPFPLVAVGDLDTMALDMATMARGYVRPALRDVRPR